MWGRTDLTRMVFVALILGVSVGAAGCGGQGHASTSSPTPGRLAIPTQLSTPLSCMDALLVGVLVPDDRWGVALATDVNAPHVQVVWPAGFYAIPGDPVRLYDASGRLVAAAGETMRIGGGYTADAYWETCADSIEAPSPT